MGKGSKKKSPPEKPEWKKLEEVIASIQQFLSPSAIVKRNDRVKGKAGRWRQLDVTVSQNINGASTFIVLECKRYSRRVGIEKVEAFVTKLDDVSASLGIMISHKGFDAGAKAMATYKKIILKTYREADETDWRNLFGTETWSIIIGNEYDILSTSAVSENNEKIESIPHNLILLNKDGTYYKEEKAEPWTIVELFLDGWNIAKKPRPIGRVQLTIGKKNPPICIGYKDKIIPARYFIIEATVVPKKYAANIKIAQANLLENSDTKKLEYIKAISEEFNVGEIMASQKGTPFTKEEWEITERTYGEMDVFMDSPAYFILEAKMK